MQRRNYIRLILIFLLASVSWKCSAQIPTTCFEIESILADACGTPEPENEMVRFKIGPNDLSIADLNVDWPANNFLGICRNATTAQKVADINASITACGVVLEPVADILPAGATVILVGSEYMVATANTFQALSDTIYMIFQCHGNTTAGHFKNWEAPPSYYRVLTMDFGPACTETVQYLPSQLVTVSGATGSADGAFIDFTWSGTQSYHNNGCQAIYHHPDITATADKSSVCPGDTVFLSAVIENFNAVSYNWINGSGTYINGNTANAQYIIGPSDHGDMALAVEVTNACGTMITDTAMITANGFVISSLQADPLPPFCKEHPVTLSTSGGDNYLWSTGATTSSIEVTNNGTYIVTVSNMCSTQTDSINMSFSDVTAAFSASPLTGSTPLLVMFTDESSPNVVSWQWDFGDGNTSTYQHTSNTYTTASIYPVTLRVTNLEGCVSYAYGEITVTGDTVTFIPSAFTPNNDLKNEIFNPMGANVEKTSGTIYNRWGQVICRWDNSEGWNGFDSHGKKQQEGIYIYDVESTYFWGQTQRKLGTVMLMR